MRNRALVLPFVVIFGLALASTFSASSAIAGAPPGPFFQGFEKNTDGWLDGDDRTIVREPSGYSNGGGYADGIPSAAGKWHARLQDTTGCTQNCDGPFTRWGGYSSTFPTGGYLTQLDIYFDTAWAATHPDTRFDWISAINSSQTSGTCPSSTNPPPCHLRDFVFNVGTNAGGFVVQSSTNSTRSGANPYVPCPNPVAPPNTCRPPAFITASGWYSFRHTFRDDAGTLAVDFDILTDKGETSVAHWTIFADSMSAVGGNRYGWFSNEEIPDLAIDNSLRTNVCKSGHGDGKVKKAHFKFDKDSCKKDGNVEEDNPDSASQFQSTSITAATFALDEDSQTLTMIGTGLNNGLPVGFTMIAVDNGGLAPAVFTLILSDGYTITGPLEEGSITIE